MEDAFCRDLEERITALDRRLTDYIEESRRAIDKAEITMNARLEGMNKFRDQILNERINFVTRDSFDSHVTEKMAELKNVEDFIANLKGRMTVTGSIIVVFSGLLAAIVSIAVKYF